MVHSYETLQQVLDWILGYARTPRIMPRPPSSGLQRWFGGVTTIGKLWPTHQTLRHTTLHTTHCATAVFSGTFTERAQPHPRKHPILRQERPIFSSGSQKINVFWLFLSGWLLIKPNSLDLIGAFIIIMIPKTSLFLNVGQFQFVWHD